MKYIWKKFNIKRVLFWLFIVRRTPLFQVSVLLLLIASKGNDSQWLPVFSSIHWLQSTIFINEIKDEDITTVFFCTHIISFHLSIVHYYILLKYFNFYFFRPQRNCYVCKWNKVRQIFYFLYCYIYIIKSIQIYSIHDFLSRS